MARTVPNWFVKKLAELRGSLGGKPLLRVVFAPDARTHLDKPRYINPLTGKVFHCFVLERRQPFEYWGTKAEWERDRYVYDDVHQEWIDAAGEYPPNDGYAFICPLSNDGEYLDLDDSVFDAIVRKIQLDEEFAEKAAAQRNEQIVKMEADKKAQEEKLREEKDGIRDEFYKTNWDRINREGMRAYSIPAK